MRYETELTLVYFLLIIKFNVCCCLLQFAKEDLTPDRYDVILDAETTALLLVILHLSIHSAV